MANRARWLPSRGWSWLTGRLVEPWSGLGDLGGDGVGVPLQEVARCAGLRLAVRVGGVERACERVREQRRLGLLDPVEHELVALHDVVELEVTDGAVADELVR